MQENCHFRGNSHRARIITSQKKMESQIFCLLIITFMGVLYGVHTDSEAASAGLDEPFVQPCTCGVFLSDKANKQSVEPPADGPALIQELDKAFACNLVGQRQCQSKCLETIVSHLPNSGNILCAAIERDCIRERAYLYIQNCNTTWLKTGLSAGREYCCKDGLPYTCPKPSVSDN